MAPKVVTLTIWKFISTPSPKNKALDRRVTFKEIIFNPTPKLLKWWKLGENILLNHFFQSLHVQNPICHEYKTRGGGGGGGHLGIQGGAYVRYQNLKNTDADFFH